MMGTLVNVAAVVAGSGVGLIVGDRLPERIKRAVLTALGLGTLLIGMQLALQTAKVILPIGALVIGAVLGTWWDLKAKLESLADRLKSAAQSSSATFVMG
ncbi:MAG: DUF554 family protein, partial [bacterium]